jgi:hypothetical protein
MTWDRSKPWTAPANTLVLYRTADHWRFAVTGEAGGILDGYLSEVDVSEPVEAAMAALVARISDATDLTYDVMWTRDRPDWWTGEVSRRA